jgi:hypothetical protein
LAFWGLVDAVAKLLKRTKVVVTLLSKKRAKRKIFGLKFTYTFSFSLSLDLLPGSLTNNSQRTLDHRFRRSSFVVPTMADSDINQRFQDAVWPASLPLAKETTIFSVVCGNTHYNWAAHQGATDQFSSKLFWRYVIR